MDKDTQIASDFTVEEYLSIRAALDPAVLNRNEWPKVTAAFERRIRERFLRPIKELARYDNKRPLPFRPGSAILALDCLLIDTIQSFREGRVSTGEISPARSFKAFFKSPRFSEFKSQDRADFFQYVRNALFHNGETRNDWKFRIDSPPLLTKDENTGTRTINRRVFHARVLGEFRELCRSLKAIGAQSTEARRMFLRRMDALCGLGAPHLRNVYFAYGSNLLETEVLRSARDARAVEMAFLPGYRLDFSKHSITRKCDAANISKHTPSMVWGFAYLVNDADRESLRERENGYQEIELSIYIVDGDDVTPQRAFTFIAKEVCPKNCGPSSDYFSLVMEGASLRNLPTEYLQDVRLRFAPRNE